MKSFCGDDYKNWEHCFSPYTREMTVLAILKLVIYFNTILTCTVLGWFSSCWILISSLVAWAAVSNCRREMGTETRMVVSLGHLEIKFILSGKNPTQVLQFS